MDRQKLRIQLGLSQLGTQLGRLQLGTKLDRPYLGSQLNRLQLGTQYDGPQLHSGRRVRSKVENTTNIKLGTMLRLVVRM